MCILTYESHISAKDPYIFPQKNPTCVCKRDLVDHRRLLNVYFGHTSLTFLDTNPYIFPQKSPMYVCKRDLVDHKRFLDVCSGTKVLHLCKRALYFRKRDPYMDTNKPFCTRDLAVWKRDLPSTEGTWSHDDKTALLPKRLQLPAARCNRDCSTLQHAATHCNTLQHTGTTHLTHIKLIHPWCLYITLIDHELPNHRNERPEFSQKSPVFPQKSLMYFCQRDLVDHEQPNCRNVCLIIPQKSCICLQKSPVFPQKSLMYFCQRDMVDHEQPNYRNVCLIIPPKSSICPQKSLMYLCNRDPVDGSTASKSAG